MDQFSQFTLPEGSPELEQCKAIVSERLEKALSPEESRFRDIPDLQRVIDPLVRDVIIEAIAETSIILGLRREQLPTFQVLNELLIQALEAEMPYGREISIFRVGEEGNGTVCIDIHFPKLYNQTLAIARADSEQERYIGELREKVAHEMFHIYDIFCNPERAKETAIANMKTDIAFAIPGEHIAMQFGHWYRRRKEGRV